MKKTLVLLVAVIVLTGLNSACHKKVKEPAKETPKNAKTIENLKAAFIGETTASAKYAEFAKKAKEEGYPQIALLFEAASKSESIHAGNHKAVLEKMTDSIPKVEIQLDVKTTAENLEAAIKGEGYEVDSMYPGFIKIAEEENVPDAKKSFTWALDTEKKHHAFYMAALDALKNKKLKDLPKEYFVCPKCGNTFNVAEPPANCDFCMTAKEKFISFK